MNKKTFIICAVFVLIISCKNFATGKDIKQNAGEKVQGFVDKILDPTKDKLTSSGSKADEVAKKLQEEDKIKGVEENDKNELMQGDDPNSGMINSPPVLSENIHNNAPALKAIEQSDGQQEKKVEEAEAKVEEKKEESAKGKEVIEEKKKEELAKQEEEQQKRKAEKEKQEEQKRQQEQEEQQRRVREEEERQRRAKEEEERQRRAKEEEEKRQVDAQIKRLTSKIDEINGDIDVIKDRVSVGAEEVRDKITGPVYDYFVDGENSIRKTWGGGDLEEDDEDSDLGKLLKELSDTRDGLRTKLNEGNKPHTGDKEPKLKTSVDVSDIKGDLEKLKSYLEKVKGYLENKDNFEDIKGYIEDSNLY